MFKRIMQVIIFMQRDNPYKWLVSMGQENDIESVTSAVSLHL